MNIQPGQFASLVLSSAVQAAVYLVTRPEETLYLDRQPLVDSRETISLTLIFTAPDHYFPCESTLSTTTTLNLSSSKEAHPTLLIFGSGLWPTPPATSLVSPVNCQQNIRPRCHHLNSHIHHFTLHLHHQSFFYQKEEELSEKSVTRPSHAVHTSTCRSHLILIIRSTKAAQRLCGSCTSVDPLNSTENCEYSRFLHTGYRRYPPSNGDFNGCGRALESDSETPSSLQPASLRTATTKLAIRGTTVHTQVSSSFRTDQCPSSTSPPGKCERWQSAHPSTELIGEQRCQ